MEDRRLPLPALCSRGVTHCTCYKEKCGVDERNKLGRAQQKAEAECLLRKGRKKHASGLPSCFGKEGICSGPSCIVFYNFVF